MEDLITYREAIQYLYELRLFGTKLGLENTRRLAKAVGMPQDRLRFIHVAGTNGKGSVCAYLEHIYRSAGFKTGMFTSPHLVQFGERMQIQGQPITRTDLVRHVQRIRQIISTWPKETRPTFFEFITVLALQYFAEQACDIVIWETGMGGRLDATNIVTPECAVITNISADHQAWLGNSLIDIAGEKAGIIKPNTPIVTAEGSPDLQKTLRQVAQDRDAPFYQIENGEIKSEISTGLEGPHQRTNAHLASKVVELLCSKFPVSDAILQEAIQTTRLPGRFQILDWHQRKVVLDVAHNIAGIQAVVDSWKKCFGSKPCALIFASLEDKPWRECLALLLPLCSAIHLVPAQSQRAESPAVMAEHLKRIAPDTETTIHDTVETALRLMTNNAHPVLITGSFYLIGGALPLLDPESYPAEEISLNEWGAKL